MGRPMRYGRDGSRKQKEMDARGVGYGFINLNDLAPLLAHRSLAPPRSAAAADRALLTAQP